MVNKRLNAVHYLKRLLTLRWEQHVKLVSQLLKHTIYPVLHHAGWFARSTRGNTCAVVTYHGVLPRGYSSADELQDGHLVSLDNFRRQLRFLKAHYNVIHPEDFRAWTHHNESIPERAVLITCDDGLLNSLTDVLPVLKSEDVSCLFFVTGSSCGETPGTLWCQELFPLLRAVAGRPAELPLNGKSRVLPAASDNFQAWWWESVRRASRLDARERAAWMDALRAQCDPIPSSFERRWRLMNLHELKQLAAGGMSIGAHTLSHPILSECSEREARLEIVSSKLELERALGQPVWAFAYPFGMPSTLGEREIRITREAGYDCAFLNVETGADQSDPFIFPRTHVSADTELAELEAHLSGFHARLQRAIRGN
jgi:peptidoglycan/xylan/chitin deacetylase (PgdA/CDA1 family)